LEEVGPLKESRWNLSSRYKAENKVISHVAKFFSKIRGCGRFDTNRFSDPGIPSRVARILLGVEATVRRGVEEEKVRQDGEDVASE
jgi:hypothetical protein